MKTHPFGIYSIVLVFILSCSSLGGDKTLVEDRFPLEVPPVLGSWFPNPQQLDSPHGYKDYLDVFARYSSYSMLTTTMRVPELQMVDIYVHDWFKNAVIYAKSRGLRVALELDVRHSVPAFKKQYPDEMQKRLWLEEFEFDGKQDLVARVNYKLSHGDAINHNPKITSVRVEKIYVYTRNSEGIDPNTVRDITANCPETELGEDYVTVTIPKPKADKKFHVCVVACVSIDLPDVFAPHLIPFEYATMKQYADVPLGGLMKDEWGFPATHDGNKKKNAFWYSQFLAEAYSRATNGRDLVRDALLMWVGEKGRESERQLAVNHLYKLYHSRNTEIEQAFYHNTKEIFGVDAFVGTHPTVFPGADAREFERDGLDWWTATRDFAQADETTPYACITSMSKKFTNSLWYNMYYAPSIETYEKNIWKYAVLGGRMNFHQLYPTNSQIWLDNVKSLLKGGLKRGDCRIRLLNFISTSPVDCPVAIIFGHANAMNWAGSSFEDVGLPLADEFWRTGYYADLIPSSEISNGSLKVDNEGNIWFGKQKYAAVVLYQPEFENPTTAEFFKKADKGGSLLYCVGEWTKDFEAEPYDGWSALPARMKSFPNAQVCTETILDDLNSYFKSLAQIPLTDTMPTKDILGREFGPSVAPSESGITRLIDGSVIVVSGEKLVAGDTIHKTINVQGVEVSFDAVGIAGIRLAQDGNVEAIAGGGLKSFKAGDFTIELPYRLDVVFLKEDGAWRGVVQGLNGKLPGELTAVTNNWKKLDLPENLE